MTTAKLTRQDEIEKAAKEYWLNTKGDNAELDFQAGAKWADENPDLTDHDGKTLDKDFLLEKCYRHNCMEEVITKWNKGKLLLALFAASENRDWWQKQYYELKRQSGAQNDTWKQSVEPDADTPNKIIFSQIKELEK